MPFVAAAVSPHPPILVPELAGRASAELDDLRQALSIALDRLYAAEPDLLIVVGSGPDGGEAAPGAVGDFAGFGHPLRVSLTGYHDVGASPGDGAPGDSAPGGSDVAALPLSRDVAALPLSLAVGAWLLRDRPLAPPRAGHIVVAGLDPDACLAIGRDLAARAPRVALLVMGDGSARRGEKSPGYADDRAPAFDAAATDAFRRGDVTALAAIPADLATDLMAAGRAPWQVLAGAAGAARVTGDVLYDAAPYGVQYTVATWTPA